jgi:thiol:disulfide interchange protein DsbD
MLKKTITLFAVLFFAAQLFAQIENPVSWAYTAKKIGPKKYELHLTATIQNSWHIYAQKAGDGPEPTTINFKKNPLLKFEGKVKEVGKLETAFDPNFNSTLRFYNKTVDFVQIVNLKSAVNTVVKGSVNFMVCNERKCLPPKEIPFSINIDAK